MATAERVFTAACVWYRAGELLFQDCNTRAWAMIQTGTSGPIRATFDPALVSCAFNLELHLKCLHILDSGAAPKTHRLIDLFDSMPPSRQQELTDAYAKLTADGGNPGRLMVQGPPRDDRTSTFRDRMVEANEVFVGLRYSYEGIGGWTAFNTNAVSAIRELPFDLMPVWRSLAAEFDA